MENAIKRSYNNVLLEFYVFLKTGTSHSRAPTLQNAISATDFQVGIVILAILRFGYIYVYCCSSVDPPELPSAFLERPGEAKVPEY